MLNHDIGIVIESSKGCEKSAWQDSNVEVIFSGGTRISKTGCGPLIPGKTNVTFFTILLT